MPDLPPNTEQTDPISELLAIERDWTAAHLAGDTAALAHIMADDFIRISPNGTLADKMAVLSGFEDDQRTWEAANASAYDVRVYDDAAVVVGHWHGRGDNRGRRFDYTARFLSVYVKRDGRWQMVAEAAVTITPASETPAPAHPGDQ